MTPGAPVTGREIRFTGNQQLDAAKLQAEIAGAGLDVEAWLDRTVVERTLRQFYSEQGFLRAEVVGRPLDIDGTVGVLTFDIKEGPQANITAVKWDGIASERLAAIQKAAALKNPAPYVAADVTEARRRIENEYRRQGFNDAEIEVIPAVGADDTVALTVEVAEGPQQVLQDVATSGLDVTSGTVLTQALRFELGKPVDLDEWAQARKRLYDTNVFRIVDIQPDAGRRCGQRRAAGEGDGQRRGVPGVDVAGMDSRSRANARSRRTSSRARATSAWSAS